MMELTKEILVATRAQLVAERDKQLAELNMTQGKIQAIDAMIQHMDKTEPEPITATEAVRRNFEAVGGENKILGDVKWKKVED